MSNFDDNFFVLILIYNLSRQNLTIKMFIIFGTEQTEVSEFFELFAVKGKEPTVTITAGSHINLSPRLITPC